MNKWIAEFDLEDGDTMPEHMDLNYKGVKIDFHCKPLEQQPCDDCVSRKAVKEILNTRGQKAVMTFDHFKELLDKLPPVTPSSQEGEVAECRRICFKAWGSTYRRE